MSVSRHSYGRSWALELPGLRIFETGGDHDEADPDRYVLEAVSRVALAA